MNRPNGLEEPQGPCSYCQTAVEDDNYLECMECRRMVHIKCLPHASTPGDLLGDVFFEFTCVKCVEEQLQGGPVPLPRPSSRSDACAKGFPGCSCSR